MDLDQDGVLDLFSGAYSSIPGRGYGVVQFFKGKKNDPLNFETPVSVKTLSGGEPNLKDFKELINPDTNKRTFPAKSPAKTKPNFVDLNADGNLDLVYGEMFGHFIRFDGTASKGINHFSDKAEILRDVDGNLLKVSSSASPHFIDWDGDSDIDIISGSDEGGIYYSENIGDTKSAKWKAFTEWVAPIPSDDKTKGRHTIQNTRNKLQPGGETTVYVLDYNHDGKLDLLVGDKTILDTPLDGVSDEEFAKKEAQYRAMEDAYGRDDKAEEAYYKLLDAEGPRTPEVKKLIATALDLSEKLSDEVFAEKRALKESFKTSKKAGFVWLYLQR